MRVNSNGLVLRVCDECEAMWLDDEYPSVGTFRDFVTYLRSLGLAGLWSDVTILSMNGEETKGAEKGTGGGKGGGKGDVTVKQTDLA